MPRRIEYDPAKDARNVITRELPFADAASFQFTTAVIDQDVRRPYGEARYQALGYLGERLHMLIFTHIDDGIRVISFRKANRREVARYAQETTAN